MPDEVTVGFISCMVIGTSRVKLPLPVKRFKNHRLGHSKQTNKHARHTQQQNV